MSFPKSFSSSLLALLLAGATPALADPPAAPSPPGSAELGPREVVSTTTEDVLAVLRDDSLSDETKRERIEQIAYARFDFSRMSRLVLARNWKKLTPEQREEFETEFKRHLSLSYGKRLGDYSGETIEITGTRQERNGDVTVLSTLVGGTNDGAEIDYRMRQSDGEWRVLDVIVESISLLANFRSQIQEIVSSKGADQLIRILREKNVKESARAEAS